MKKQVVLQYILIGVIFKKKMMENKKATNSSWLTRQLCDELVSFLNQFKGLKIQSIHTVEQFAKNAFVICFIHSFNSGMRLTCELGRMHPLVKNISLWSTWILLQAIWKLRWVVPPVLLITCTESNVKSERGSVHSVLTIYVLKVYKVIIRGLEFLTKSISYFSLFFT